MHVAIPLYPRFTALDAVGPYTVLAFAPGHTVTFVAGRTGPVPDDHGTLTINATATYADLPAPDVIVVPGGSGTFDALADEALVSWIGQAHEHTRWTTSVCSGSLLLGAAGLLDGVPATSHWALLDALKQYGAEPTAERVVSSGKIVTGAGVSAGIDMALALLSRSSDVETAQTVQLLIEYDPQPPFDCGSAKNASQDMMARALSLLP
ncbi:DJ-1/PfpI family protein [Nonomuraea sp. MG754425]|uniref:DJ-1/PfpI family protein n=1 Tax=Nonomuraea sp. MG754425 TaxID=2570319 RepID=UPI001F1A72B1|nr:DJ-1/PfpI family protein [Nonomuraea sp. MG754425]MCF6472905.1 DJ-1/PfpI family protein [Nonomuraea sp. MG754425]